MMPARTRREIPYETKLKVVNHLIQFMALGKLKRGAISSTAALFGLHRDTVSKSWSSFRDLDSMKLESVFLTFQAVMRLVLEKKGGNQFRLLHLS
ncbi:hypothetical protein DYB32_000096 [Aphanomyces invadans]|uniref:HTH psq-type domain-containing protein n=1 Tax=Aphanomyces invadans TaxID=157072 RepID=A0A418BAZ5_9STRA|nr:hypothetical protein DYB32_000096 [Aphanomyces invadans]